MTGRLRVLMVLLFWGFAFDALAFRCQVCGKDGYGQIFIATDKTTGEKEYVCADCAKLPRCYICGLPVRTGGTTLPDGRFLCARDAKTAVLDVNEAKRICLDVENKLNRTYSRFTEFPANVQIDVMDRVDIYSMADTVGNTYESPDILGVYHPEQTDGGSRDVVRLLTGQPLARLRNVCAHELSHAWVHANVSSERHQRLARDAEEGFCEMMAYLLMDSEGEDAEKKRILANAYTRGQVQLFIEAEQHYGFQPVLDWMQYGETSRLEEGHLDRIRDARMPATMPAKPATATTVPANNNTPAVPPKTAPAALELEGILPGAHPMAIINHHTFTVGDEAKVNVGTGTQTIRCLAIQKDSAHIKDTATGKEQDLFLSP